MLWLAPLGLLGIIRHLRAHPEKKPPAAVLLAGFVAVIAPVAVALLFGEQLAPRYLLAPSVALLPWVGRLVPSWTHLGLLWPALAVLTQVAHHRAAADPMAAVPDVPVISSPQVDAGPLFDESSTEDATALRAQAEELARTLPKGATVTVTRRPHGREGELVWPLRVARPDIKFEYTTP